MAERAQSKRLNCQLQALSREANAGKAKVDARIRKVLGIGPDDDVFERIAALIDDSATLSYVRDTLPHGTSGRSVRKALLDMSTSHALIQQIEVQFGTATTQTLTRLMSDSGFPAWYGQKIRRQMYWALACALGCALVMIFR
jgi:hypothetical protein